MTKLLHWINQYEFYINPKKYFLQLSFYVKVLISFSQDVLTVAANLVYSRLYSGIHFLKPLFKLGPNEITKLSPLRIAFALVL